MTPRLSSIGTANVNRSTATLSPGPSPACGGGVAGGADVAVERQPEG